MKLIEYAKLNPTVGMRKIAEVFKCGRTQVQTILKAKKSIISDFETNAPAVETRLRLGKRGLRHLDILLKIFGTRTRQAASFRHFLRDL